MSLILSKLFESDDINNLIKDYTVGDTNYWKKQFTSSILNNNFLYGNKSKTKLIINEDGKENKLIQKLTIVNEIIKAYMVESNNNVIEIYMTIDKTTLNNLKVNKYSIALKIDNSFDYNKVNKQLSEVVEKFGFISYFYNSSCWGPAYNPNNIQVGPWKVYCNFIM